MVYAIIDCWKYLDACDVLHASEFNQHYCIIIRKIILETLKIISENNII